MKLYYPARPFRVTQPWGIKDSFYKQFYFSLHNGVDIALGTDKKIFAPIEGEVVTIGNQPTGGGIYVSMITGTGLREDIPEARVLIDFLHMERIITKVGTKVAVGSLLGIADNTGAATTGNHTHIQFRWVEWKNGKFLTLEKNEAHNSFDPTPYWTGEYADVFNLSQQIGILGKLLELIKNSLSSG